MCLSVCAVRPSVRAVRLALVVLSLSATSTVVSAQQVAAPSAAQDANVLPEIQVVTSREDGFSTCLLYTSDAADDSLRADLGGRRGD